jgi:lysophospholipase L1-like esterase
MQSGGTSRRRDRAKACTAVRRLALITLGVGLAIAVLEIGLQLGALALRATGRQTPVSWLGGRRRVLCLGDSNTYGLRLANRADAYPQQLERLWNAAAEHTAIEVLNLGYPGTNSSKLIHDLPRMLETLRPDVVIIMVGANDFWTAPVPPADAAGVSARAFELVERYSRVYQLIYMLRRAFDHRQLEVNYPAGVNGGEAGTARFGDVEFSLGWRRLAQLRAGAETYVQLRTNLLTLAGIVRSFGAEPLFLTYASAMWNYGDASHALRSAAADSGVRVIDAAVPIAAVCPAEPCPDWLYADHHPTAAGYRVMAEEVVRALAE